MAEPESVGESKDDPPVSADEMILAISRGTEIPTVAGFESRPTMAGDPEPKEDEKVYSISAAGSTHIWAGSETALKDRFPSSSPIWGVFHSPGRESNGHLELPESAEAVKRVLWRDPLGWRNDPNRWWHVTGWRSIDGGWHGRHPFRYPWSLEQLLDIFHLVARFERVDQFSAWLIHADAFVCGAALDPVLLTRFLSETADSAELPVSFHQSSTFEKSTAFTVRRIGDPAPAATETITIESPAARWEQLREIAAEYAGLVTESPTGQVGWAARAISGRPELLEQLLSYDTLGRADEIRKLIESEAWRRWLRATVYADAKPKLLVELTRLERAFQPTTRAHWKIYYAMLFRWWSTDRAAIFDALSEEPTDSPLTGFWGFGANELDRLKRIPSNTTHTWYPVRTGLEQRVVTEQAYEEALIDHSYSPSDTAPIRIACSGSRRRRVTSHGYPLPEPVSGSVYVCAWGRGRTGWRRTRHHQRPIQIIDIGQSADTGKPAPLPRHTDLSRWNLASAWIRQLVSDPRSESNE